MSGLAALLELKWTVPATAEDDFDAWYDQEHLDDLLAVPGVLEGRRFYRAGDIGPLAGTENHLTHYWLRDDAALAEPSYLRLGQEPSAWTRRVAFDLPLERHIHHATTPGAGFGSRGAPSSSLLVVGEQLTSGAADPRLWAAVRDVIDDRPQVEVRRDDGEATRISHLVEAGDTGEALLAQLALALDGHTDRPNPWTVELYHQRYARHPA